jgi:hypothetical protein
MASFFAAGRMEALCLPRDEKSQYISQKVHWRPFITMLSYDEITPCILPCRTHLPCLPKLFQVNLVGGSLRGYGYEQAVNSPSEAAVYPFH